MLDAIATIRASYWFFPSVMMLGAIALSLLTVYVDARVRLDDQSLPPILLTQADGAKTLLATIAGSVLSVASLTFSIVMVVLTMASAQYGPRLLENFMRDRGNQIVLGLFISTFLYCLLILRVVRGDGGVVEGAFVPQISLMTALLLAVVSVVGLVYFIHHTTTNIQASTIVARVSDNLTRKILETFPERPLFPESLGADFGQGGGLPHLPAEHDEAWAPVIASKGGYLRAIDEDDLMDAAADLDLLLVLRVVPGSYTMRGEALARAYPRARLAGHETRIETKFSLGSGRTQNQDYAFLFDQLQEMALRALSPGVNDPVTAIMCVDRISDNLNLLAKRELPSPYRSDDEGALRIVVPRPDARDLLVRLFGPIRNYAKSDYMTLLHLLDVLRRLEGNNDDPVFRAAVREEAERVKNDAEVGLSPLDYRRLVDAHAEMAA